MPSLDPAIVAEVTRVMDDYREVFFNGTREQAQAFVHLPVLYISEDDVQLRERYPFDPEKLRAQSGIAKADVDMEVIHADATKAHVLLHGRRMRADGSLVEDVEAVYILQKREGVWKIAAFSGVRTPAEED